LHWSWHVTAFGIALGLFEGISAVPRLSEKLGRAVRRLPIYTDEHLIADGTWRVVGHDEQLLPLFPSQPEIYHGPDNIFNSPRIGEFGAAETADETLRQITREKAIEVGLLDNTYRQTYVSDHLQELLNEKAL
jgi:hypothetical protein